MSSSKSTINAKRAGAPNAKLPPTPKRVTPWFALIVLLTAMAVGLACGNALRPTAAAFADDTAVVHVSYQWYSAETGMTEDYEVFDVDARVSDGRLTASIMPEAYELGDGCTWRVMKNFAGGLPAGETEITDEAAYDEATGELSLPEQWSGEDVTIVFCMPWDHASHDGHGHFHAAATRSARGLRATSTEPTVGQTYYLSIQSGDTGRSSSPIIYGADSDNAGAGPVFGYPEFEGRYKFYVAFESSNCELFELCDSVPGRWGAGGTIYGSTGTPYNTDWAADYQWCSADCVESVYNTGGDPVPLQGSGSWVRIDDISGGTISCSFRIQCDNPDGSNAQDIMGTFSLDVPYGAIAFQKDTANLDVTDGNALYTLEGARYGIYNSAEKAATRSESDALATYVTDSEGYWETDAEYRVGTYYIAELEAPRGYALDEGVIEVSVPGGQTASVTAADTPLTAPASMSVQKRDSETDAAVAQGDATLEGAEVTFCYYDGYYEAEELPDEPTRTWVMRTTADGIASPSHGDSAKASGDEFYRDANGGIAFPLGTVAAIETKAPEGYLIGEPELLVMHVSATDDGSSARIETVKATRAGEAADGASLIDDAVMRGSLVVGKVSRENGAYLEQGAASLEGWTFEIVNRSSAPVVVEGESYDVGEVVKTISTESTDGAFVANAGESCLPYGTYEVREVQTMRDRVNGYLFDDESKTWSQTVSIREDGQIVDLTGEADACANQVVRGDIELVKVKSPNMQRLAGIPFRVTSTTTGEWHVIVTDANGCATTASETNPHDQNPNGSDGAIGDDGSVDESRLDDEAGVWFYGRIDAPTIPNPAKGALPFDTYTVEELRVAANEGLDLLTFDVTVSRDATTIDLGTVGDSASITPLIATSLADEGGSAAAEASPVTRLVDTVAFNNLDTTCEYTLTGELRAVVDGQAGDLVATSQRTFKPALSHGTEHVAFEFDSSELGGQSLVCFEYLADAQGNPVAEHVDPTDEGQTVIVTEPESWPEPEPFNLEPDEPSSSHSEYSPIPQTGDPLFALPLALASAGAMGLALAALGVRNLERTYPVDAGRKKRKQ